MTCGSVIKTSTRRCAPGDSRSFDLRLFDSPAPAPVTVTVLNKAPAVLDVPAGATIAAGATSLTLPVTGLADGEARLRFVFNGENRVSVLDSRPSWISRTYAVYTRGSCRANNEKCRGLSCD